MGVRNYLIEGVSGAGKTTVAEELQRRGHHVIHGDRALAYRGDPGTGMPANPGEALARRHATWIWDVDKVRALASDRTQAATFFCGGARNHGRYIHLFDGVFALHVDLDTLKRRVAGRGDDEFGGKPDEWAMLARLHATQEDIPAGAVRIDASRPVPLVVDDILARCALGEADAS